ncbi:MAG: chromosome partitioning protein ParB [Gammaproteobacteria bacterium]|nr:chromosome partitioning protein ParB [Gammaproteobacteria bacterium]|tara:strand:- start:239 stop:718 length:480 start_codon:yes stop_codon:yes gene_type:complete
MVKIKLILLFLILFLLSPIRSGEIFEVNISRIVDGDTVVVTGMGDGLSKVRLHAIDTPERGQAHYLRSKKALKNFLGKGEVSLKKIAIDRYGRIVGELFVGDVSINLKMIKTGNAWCYEKYNKNIDFTDAEKLAREKAIGIWALPKSKQIAPWIWRRKN